MKSRSVLVSYFLFVLLHFTTAVQFNVSGILGNIHAFACHESAILHCIVSSGTNPVFWQVGKPVFPSTAIAAECSGQSCHINPAVSGKYSFSYDDISGISNLTIFNVTSEDDRMQYICDDGSSPPPSPFVGNVQDPPEPETTHIINVSDPRNRTSITVRTSCVSPSLVEGISFKWFTLKKEENLLEVYSMNTTSRQEVPCPTAPGCIINGSAQISETFSVEEDQAFPIVFFQAQVMFNRNMLFAITSSAGFRIKYHVTPPLPQDCDKCWVIIVIILSAARVLFLQAWLSAYCFYKTKQDDECISFLATSLGIFFPGLGILFIGLKIVRDGCIDKLMLCGLIILGFCFVAIEIILALLCLAIDVDCLYLYVVGAFYLLLIDVCDGCITFYVVFKTGRKSESSGETNTTISIHPLGTDERYRCDSCKRITTIKHYCMECNKFLCDSCNTQHKCDGIRLRHLQHEGSKREAEFCCDNSHKHKKYTTAAHGYCLTCSMYLCTECLITHHKDKDNLLWIPYNDGISNDGLCCYRGHTDCKEITHLGYCKQCKIYVCTQCTEKHKEHSLVIHHEQGGDFDKCKMCQSMAECFHLNNRNCLCSVCYEHGDFPVRGSALDENLSEIIKKQQKCMLHDVFGDGAAHFSTDVYCLKCRLYLCTGCFKHHRRLKEDWIRTHKSNLFTCKKCQAEKNVFPVECLVLAPVMLLCAECFECSDNNRTDIPEINNLGVREAMHKDFVINKSCQLHKPPFQKNDKNVRSSVYCLVCKTYMCRECFQSHRRLRNIMKPVAEEKPKDTQIDEAATKKRHYKICIVICGFIPIFGILFNLAFCRMKMSNAESATGDGSISSNDNHRRSNTQRL